MIQRREFITLLGGTVAAWPIAARAQQAGKPPTIGFMGSTTASAGAQWVAAFVQRLRELGWLEGRNVAIEYRWAEGHSERFAEIVAEFVRLKADVIVTHNTPTVLAAKQATLVIPIVFATAGDPVGSGLVASLARPGGNVTGFMSFEYSLSGKWLGLLKEIAPSVTRTGVLRDPSTPSGIGQTSVIQAMASTLSVEVTALGLREATELERGIAAFARAANGGLIVTNSSLADLHRDLIIALAARHKLPTVFGDRSFAHGGGLVSYGPDRIDGFRRAAGYVDRILRGDKPSDLPVQAPVKYETVINLKTAKTLGLELPASVLARADEVIE
jgi:putative tryptophan/tyrosine transport system substrate-binding protein